MATVQSNVEPETWTPAEQRVASACIAHGAAGCALYRVPPEYYTLPLRMRAQLLGAPEERLCKCLVLENTHGRVVGDPTRGLALQKYLCVVLQYTTKLCIATLERQVGLHASNPPSTAPHPVRLALCATADCITGFGHNAMTPFGSTTALAVIVARPIVKLPAPAYIWLGGGGEDMKLRVFVSQLLKEGGVGARGYAPAVLDCVTERGDGEEQD